MRSLGITSLRELSVGRLHKIRSHLAYTVLEEINSETDDELIDLVYYYLPGSPVSLKRTYRNRYKLVDEVVIEEIQRLFAPGSTLNVHEMAASNAITSLEFYDRLKGLRDTRFYATDYYNAVYVVSPPSSHWRVVFNADYSPLQFVSKWAVIPADHRSMKGFGPIRLPLTWVIKSLLRAAILPKALRILRVQDESHINRISLFHPRCVALANENKGFTLGRHNIFEPEGRSYEIVRLMGTVKSFSTDKVKATFRAVSMSVIDGGLLVVGVQRDKTRLMHVPTTIFRRCGSRLVAICDVMGGYERREELLELELPR